MKKKSILVTGGAGFIGSNIVEELVRLKKPVVVLDDFSSGLKENIKPFLSKIKLIRGDIRNPRAVNKAMKGIGIVIHQAAIRSVPKSVDNPFLSHEVNTSGTLVLLDAAVRYGVKRFVYASSSAAYGDVTKFPQHESDGVKPLSPYGASKLCAEHYCHCYHENFGLETVALRYFNVYGPRQNPESLYSAVVPAFIDNVRKGESPKIDGTGKQSRDFTYVKDVARANLRAAFSGSQVAGRTFNIASGHDYSVLKILQVISNYLNAKPKRIHGPRRKGDAMRTFANISAARKWLGWRPLVSLDRGLKETVQWFEKSNPKRY